MKIFVCGTSLRHLVLLSLPLIENVSGPPGQVAAVAGKKSGFNQGELGGILKELGYTQEQVSFDQYDIYTS